MEERLNNTDSHLTAWTPVSNPVSAASMQTCSPSVEKHSSSLCFLLAPASSVCVMEVSPSSSPCINIPNGVVSGSLHMTTHATNNSLKRCERSVQPSRLLLAANVEAQRETVRDLTG